MTRLVHRIQILEHTFTPQKRYRLQLRSHCLCNNRTRGQPPSLHVYHPGVWKPILYTRHKGPILWPKYVLLWKFLHLRKNYKSPSSPLVLIATPMGRWKTSHINYLQDFQGISQIMRPRPGIHGKKFGLLPPRCRHNVADLCQHQLQHQKTNWPILQ